MRKGYVKVSTMMAALMLALSGCGTSYPQLAPEDEVLVGEYAAKLLLKYDANNRSRLVAREELVLEEAWEESKMPEETPQEDASEESVSEEPVVIEKNEGQQTSSENMVGSLAEFYELGEDISINVQEMEVCDSYPLSGEADAYFALDATEGKRLIVLKLAVENHSQSDKEVDFLSKEATLQITVNGGYTRNVLPTLLTDDMSTYRGSVPAGEVVNLVLLAEADKDVADGISTLMLKVKNDLKTCTIQIK